MVKPSVSILEGPTIHIGYAPLFRDNVDGSRERFVVRALRSEAVLSIEIDEQAGYGVVHLQREIGSVHAVMTGLAAQLIEPANGTYAAPAGSFVAVRREGSWVSYARAPRRLSGIGRWLYLGLGYGFLGLSIVGVVSPFVPTTPFVLLSSYFFVRSSPVLHGRLLRSRLFGPILRDWYVHRAMRRSLRRKLLLIMFGVFASTVALAGLSSPAVPIMLLVSLFSFSVVMQIPVIEDAQARRPRLAAPTPLLAADDLPMRLIRSSV